MARNTRVKRPCTPVHCPLSIHSLVQRESAPDRRLLHLETAGCADHQIVGRLGIRSGRRWRRGRSSCARLQPQAAAARSADARLLKSLHPFDANRCEDARACRHLDEESARGSPCPPASQRPAAWPSLGRAQAPPSASQRALGLALLAQSPPSSLRGTGTMAAPESSRETLPKALQVSSSAQRRAETAFRNRLHSSCTAFDPGDER